MFYTNFDHRHFIQKMYAVRKRRGGMYFLNEASACDFDSGIAS
jgi:hypothetical protein